MSAPNVIKQGWIKREDLQANVGRAVYLFGDNTLRRGTGGQAGAMRGEPNAIGIATKLTPTSGSNAFFSDADLDANRRILAEDMRAAFAARDKGLTVVVPLDGLGTGLSELPERAPETNRFLLWLLELLEDGRTPAWKELLNGN